MADRNATEGKRLLEQWGFMLRADPTERFAVNTPGRADVLGVHNYTGVGATFEFKCGGDGWDTRDWTDKQREWAASWSAPTTRVPSFIWFTLGIGYGINAADPLQRRRHWVVPNTEFLRVVNMVSQVQFTFLYHAGKGTRKELQQNGWDAIRLLEQWELPYQRDKGVFVPDHHPLHHIVGTVPRIKDWYLWMMALAPMESAA